MALETMVDRELCVQAADRALAYLRERVLDDTWVAAHRDIAYYFKAPQAFLLAGLRDEASAAFDALEPFLDEGGAASGSAAYRLAYPHYPYMWAAKAARELGRTEVAAACDARLREWQAFRPCGVVVGGDGDLFATAMRAFNALTFGRLEEAKSAADVLVWVVNRQQREWLSSHERQQRVQLNDGTHSRPSKFRLRWDAATTNTDAPAWISPPAEGGLPLMFYEVDRFSQGPQLYFMLAFPAMVLLELHARGQDVNRPYRYLCTAVGLLAFLRSCAGISGSLFAHKAAVAAAMEPTERDLAAVISQYLVSQQRAHGGFADDADAMDTVDQTAEVACWLRMLPELAAATEPASWTVAGF